MKKIWMTALAGLLAAGALAGCAEKPEGTPSDGSTGALSAESTGAPVTTAPKPDKDLNPLTGEYDIEPGAATRPVAIMIGNNDRSRPQQNIDKADYYLEAETEGGITRIMAVFAGPSRIPEKLGPLRSARPPFIQMAGMLDAVYANYGGQSKVRNYIKANQLDNIDFIYNSAKASWDDKTIDKGAEYRHMTSAELITKRIGELKYKTGGAAPAAFKFGSAPAGGGAGKEATVKFSGVQTDRFVYDDGSGLYTKYNGSGSKATVHKSAAGEPLTVKNVLILYDQIGAFEEDKELINFTLKEGEGWLLTGGSSRAVAFKRASGTMKYYGADGKELVMNPGKTFICLVRKSMKDSTALA